MLTADWRFQIHPIAWWIWGISVAAAGAAGNLQTQVLLIILVPPSVWQLLESEQERTAYKWMLRFAASMLLMRLVLQVFLGSIPTSEPLIALPQLNLPFGMHLGGGITANALFLAIGDGLKMALVVIGMASASTLCHPSRLLQTLPAQFQELSLLLTTATTLLPNLARDAEQLRAAERWRGETPSKWQWVQTKAIPLAESAFERSLKLGAAVALRKPQTSRNSWRRALAAVGALIASLGLGLLLVGIQEAAAPVLVSLGVAIFTASLIGNTQVRYLIHHTWNFTSGAVIAFIAISLFLLIFSSQTLWIACAALACIPLLARGLVGNA